MRNETIVDRVVERLKAQPLGDLITEEDLHDIVKQAIPKVFFEGRTVGEGYNRKEIEAPMYTAMRELLKDQAAIIAQKWLAENADLMKQYWEKIMEEGLLTYVQKAQEAKINSSLKDVVQNLILKPINDERRRQGLADIIIY